MKMTFFKIFALANALTLIGGYLLYRTGVFTDEPVRPSVVADHASEEVYRRTDFDTQSTPADLAEVDRTFGLAESGETVPKAGYTFIVLTSMSGKVDTTTPAKNGTPVPEQPGQPAPKPRKIMAGTKSAAVGVHHDEPRNNKADGR
ncbi:MAG TPA: hypothetical protein VEJ63_16550 [Planctomycetota bacterium]|nr:hypothetical protein [Planctomycetota bacterium]